MNIRSVKEAKVKGKNVFLRADLDIPSPFVDFSRLEAWFPTLEYLAKEGANVIIAGHLGRPKNKDPKLSLEPVAQWLAKKINTKPTKAKFGDFDGWILAENVKLLENLRYYSQEEENDSEFSKKLSELSDIYVNDAFASSHREHASIVGITKYLPSYAGLHLLEEVRVLSKILTDPKRPLTVIIGGAKIETKLPLVENMHKFADYVLVGGEIAVNTQVLSKVAHEKVKDNRSVLVVAELNNDKSDITPKSFSSFAQIINSSKVIIWNGPMGIISEDKKPLASEEGTKSLAYVLSRSNAFKVVGGGDTIAYLNKIKALDHFDFVSTGGGAMLELLAGVNLPGLKALSVNKLQ